jgi:hypothetical protein
MPFHVPVCAPSEENGAHNGSITHVRVPTLGQQRALSVFTSKELSCNSRSTLPLSNSSCERSPARWILSSLRIW